MSQQAPPLAIFYHPDGFDTASYDLMGRRAAGKNFLEAWIERRGAETLHCVSTSRKSFESFCTVAKACGASGKAEWIGHDRPELLGPVGTLYFPAPDISEHAWRRYRRNPKGWSIIGVTHTICTKAVMDGISSWLRAPVEPWDAVICTSKAVRDSIETQMQAEREFLQRRLGATTFSSPQLPIIPLGVPTGAFTPDEGIRARARAAYGIGDDDLAAIFVGRLSIYGKAHPVPMFIALERAARATGKRVHLLLVGWFANDSIRKAFESGLTFWCPSVTPHIIDGRKDDLRHDAWQAGDVFVSLVDNIQETFGLTPVEAMAAGLPSVVSDWDGYRDTVRHGLDGFRIPTCAPPPVFGEALMDRYAADLDSYDYYLAKSAAMIVVDTEAAAKALIELFNDPELRKRMGAAARQHAVERFDWQVVLGAYEDLATDLAARRKAAPDVDPKESRRWPARLSPFEMFANYPSRVPLMTDRVRLQVRNPSAALINIAHAERAALASHDKFVERATRLFEAIGKAQAPTMAEIAAIDGKEQQGQMILTLLTMAKFGLISLDPANGADGPRKGMLGY